MVEHSPDKTGVPSSSLGTPTICMNERKTLQLDLSRAMFLGVLSGIAEYFKADLTLIRIAFVFIVLVSGFFPGVVMYFIAWLLMRSNEPATCDEHCDHNHGEEPVV